MDTFLYTMELLSYGRPNQVWVTIQRLMGVPS